jgi:hypothetical protein
MFLDPTPLFNMDSCKDLHQCRARNLILSQIMHRVQSNKRESCGGVNGVILDIIKYTTAVYR